MNYWFFSRNRWERRTVQPLLQVWGNFHWRAYLNRESVTDALLLVLDCFLDLVFGVHFSQDIGFVDQGKGMLYFAQLLGAGKADNLIDHIKSLAEIFLFAEALGFQHLGFDVPGGWVTLPDQIVVVPSF